MDLSTPRVMGIINITPDSFYKASRSVREVDLLGKIERMLKEGADFIDVGAFSSRPNSDLISFTEERERLIKPLQQIIKHFPKAIISVDTYRSEIAKEVINEGAHIINDISGGDFDSTMFETIRELNVPYILMHMQGKPKTMQERPSYEDVFKEVYLNFSDKLDRLHKLGVNDVILDPGFGFGKSIEHNYQLLKKLNYFHSLGHPLLAGLSRKGMIQKLINVSANEALNGTTAANVIALLNGATILRVHDVKAAKEAIQIVDFYQKQ